MKGKQRDFAENALFEVFDNFKGVTEYLWEMISSNGVIKNCQFVMFILVYLYRKNIWYFQTLFIWTPIIVKFTSRTKNE